MSFTQGSVSDFRTYGVSGFLGQVASFASTSSTLPDYAPLYFVRTVNDLPAPVANVITLPADTSWFLCDFIDLGASRLVCGGVVTIFGPSSETAGISGSVNSPLLTSTFTLALANFTFTATGIQCLDLDGLGNDMALDWHGVNFMDTANVGTVLNPANFIFDTGAMLNSSNLRIGGTLGTLSFFQSLFAGQNIAQPIICLAAGLVVQRRMRLYYSSISSPALCLGLEVGAGVTIPVESARIENCAFSGAGAYLTGITAAQNESLFQGNTGISNTASICDAYVSVAAATVIADTVTFVAIAGTLVTLVDTSRWTVSAPSRFTCDAIIERLYLLQVNGSFLTGNNNQIEMVFWDSVTNLPIVGSSVISTANTGGRAENQTMFATVRIKAPNYVEVRVRNLTGANNITFERLAVVVTEV